LEASGPDDFRNMHEKTPMNRHVRSIAIAGAWGYIGRKFLDAARQLNLSTSVFDPGPAPDDVDLRTVTRVSDEAAFYQLSADLFHLAVHPEQRVAPLQRLLTRAADSPLLILVEKPMAAPEEPQQCQQIITAVDRSRAVVLYDFPELFDPLTRRIAARLAELDQPRIERIYVERSKDREDPAIPRNMKRMVTIQYQESVHCLAFVLALLATQRGNLKAVLDEGISASARAEPYRPPNPDVYPYVVDGKCDYQLQLGDVAVEGHTNFKTGAPWSKRRVIAGTASGRPFSIEANDLEAAKSLAFDGADQGFDPRTDSYVETIKTLAVWSAAVDVEQLRHGCYPHCRFTRLAYQLSSVLWRSSYDAQTFQVASQHDLEQFDAQFATAAASFPRYPDNSDASSTRHSKKT